MRELEAELKIRGEITPDLAISSGSNTGSMKEEEVSDERGVRIAFPY